MLTLENLSVGYAGKVLQSNINATLQTGALTCLIGCNGAGKSTLLRSVTGFQQPLAGKVSINGKDLSDLSRQQLAREVAVVLTGRTDIQHMTVREAVALGRTPHTDMWGRLSPEDEDIISESMSMTGITPLADRLITTLSDGEMQKATIARALAQQTPVIILDEPTAFLDYPSKAETFGMLRRLAADKKHPRSILLSTHDLELAVQHADNLWIMHHGKQMETLSHEEIRKRLSEHPTTEELCGMLF